MHLKNTIKEILDSSKNVRATLRWLKTSNKELWEKILVLTSFLPSDSSAPQRVWHIVNDVYEIPKCPISNKCLQWHCFEHGYKKYADKKSRYFGAAIAIKQTISKEGHWRKKDPEKSKNANTKFSERFNDGQHKPWNERNRNYKQILDKSKQTCLERYGVDNYRKTAKMRELNSRLVYERYLLSGGIPKDMWEEKDRYYSEVLIHTNKNWYENYHKINPENKIRGKNYHLDHIYSCSEGFKNSIPPEIIGHWTNLRIIDARENQSKKEKCGKTEQQLYEDYYKNS